MLLVKDVVMHILRMACKSSNTDCTNIRLVMRLTAYDRIIYPEFKSRLNKFVHHALIDDHATIDMPNWVLPSDVDIEKKLFKGIFDVAAYADVETLQTTIFAQGKNNLFDKLIHVDHPKSDFWMTSEDISASGQPIQPLDLNTWEFLNYPIINVSSNFPSMNAFLLMAAYETSKIHMLRLMLNSSNDNNDSYIRADHPPPGEYDSTVVTYKLIKQITTIEAIYFPETIPAEIAVFCSGIIIKMQPTRKYCYIGMLMNNGVDVIRFMIPKSVKFGVIGWMPGCCYEQFSHVSFTTTFYDSKGCIQTIAEYSMGAVSLEQKKFLAK
jgi:hypothetical protein